MYQENKNIKFLKLKDLFNKNVKECNIFVLLILAVMVISFFGATSYAIFTREVSGTGSIKMVVGKLEMKPTLKNSITAQGVVSDGAGLYSSTETNDGSATYYYHGAVENNYVSFAGYTWRVIRINEDGTVRLIMQDGINDNARHYFSSTGSSGANDYKTMYYTENNVEFGVMKMLEDWYSSKLASYDSFIVTSTYCEQAKVKSDAYLSSGSATMEVFSSYTPDFKCKEDGNEKGIVTSKIGLISVDEVLYAGGTFDTTTDFYLANGNHFWTMSPAGSGSSESSAWSFVNCQLTGMPLYFRCLLYPVISLKSNLLVSGSGKADDMWIIQS